jgi:hypothetical protein
MTAETLKRANQLKKEINEIDNFMSDCKNCWNILKVIRPNRIKLKTAYGCIANEIDVSTELADKILMTMNEYKLKLMLELERL